MKRFILVAMLTGLCSCAGLEKALPHGKAELSVGALGANVAVSYDTRDLTGLVLGAATGAGAGAGAGVAAAGATK